MAIETEVIPVPDLVWRAQISGLLLDLTKVVQDLAEVTHALAVKLDADSKTPLREDEE